MVAGLREKQALEEGILKSERLAAIGRVAAGMAHEINNPLGAACSTPSIPTASTATIRAERTLDLLGRGLAEVKPHVQALLVNARLEERMLSAQDLDDVTHCESPGPQTGGAPRLGLLICILSGVPSSQVRQVLNAG